MNNIEMEKFSDLKEKFDLGSGKFTIKGLNVGEIAINKYGHLRAYSKTGKIEHT